MTIQANLKLDNKERNHKAVRNKRTSTHAYTPSELTSLLHCHSRAGKHATIQKLLLRRQRIKCEEQKHVNLLCPKESELLYSVLCGIVSLTLHCSTLMSSIIDDKCDMTALLRKLQSLQMENYLQLTQCATRRSLSKQNHISKSLNLG